MPPKDNHSDETALLMHDLKSPIAALETILSIIPRSEMRPRKEWQVMVDIVKRLKDMTYGNNRLNNRPQFTELAPVLERLVSEKRWQYRLTSTKLLHFIDLTHTPVFAQVCESDLQRVLSNLLDNAIEASRIAQRGRRGVRVVLKCDESRIEIRVSDSGPGFPGGMRQLERGSTKSGRLRGYGLVNAFQLTEGMAGKLLIQPEGGQGTAVALSLPAVLPRPDKVDVVLIDDDVFVRDSWRQMLATKNLCLASIPDDKVAVRYLSNLPRDIPIFVDCHLRGRGGEGLKLGESLRHQGFCNLWLTTGFPKKGLAPWARGVINKTPPRWLFHGRPGDLIEG